MKGYVELLNIIIVAGHPIMVVFEIIPPANPS
jgi:hypothetical protein